MKADTGQSSQVSDFRIRSTLGVALAGLLFLAPFAINNFIQGRHLLGAGSLAIVLFLAYSAWGSIHGRYRPIPIFVVLVPASVLFLILSFRDQGVIGALWCYPAVIAFYFMLPERMAWLANAILLGIALPQAWLVLDHALAVRVAATLVVVSIFAAIFVRAIGDQQKRLEAQALTDPLTGLANRVMLQPSLEHAIRQHQRKATPMTLLAIDLDHFKSINDTLGHSAGDEVLRKVGGLLEKRVRRADQVFRVGGEEFLVLLYEADATQGTQVAEELRQAISSQPLLPDRTVTASLGVATLLPDDDWKSWMQRSDEKLYLAKENGRNRVEC